MTNMIFKVAIIVLLLVALFSWFYRVWKIMRERKRTVKIAFEQLMSIETQNDPESKSIHKQKEAYYRYSVRLYHIALENPFNWFPATLMGFRPIKEDCTS